MSKRQLFVIIYVCIWSIIQTSGCLYCNTYNSRYWFVVLFNIIFLTITVSYIFIKPIRVFVDKYIINKLP